LNLSRRRPAEANLDYVIARAKKTATAAEILSIELDPTKRHILTQEEVLTIFGHIGTVLRGKFLKMRNDLPLACVSAVTTN
jgi:hypothetical protein